MQTKYHIITSHEEVRKLVKACKTTGYCSYDFETNAQPRYKKEFKPTILSISFMPGFGCSIPLDHFETSQYVEEGWDWKKELKYFGEKVICNPDITKVAQNAKFDNQILELYDIYYRGVLLDTMLAKYILDENTPHGLKDLVRKYLPEYGDYEKQDAFDKIPWDQKPLEPLCQYGCQDTDYTLRLMIFFEKKLIDKGLYSLYRNMIMAASRVLTAVEKNGLYMDREFNQHLLETYKPKIDDARNTCLELPRVKKFAKAFSQEKVGAYINSLEEELEQLDENNPADKRKIASRQQKISNIKAGIFSTKKEQDLIRPVNLGSNIDLTQLMFLHPKGFKFPVNKISDSGKPSTDEETLVSLRLTLEDPKSAKAIFLDRLLELRGLEKMYKTYILGWSEKVQDDSCLHGRFNIQGTSSGRLSSADPNAQQIPKTSVDPNIKQQLVARPGTLYLASDFSQCIEGNSYIFCNRGLKKLKDIQPGKDKIYLMDPQWVNHSRLLNIEGLAYKGTAKCLKIITNTGRELVLTEDHPVKTYGGFTKAQELKIGDNLYIENVASSKRIGNIHIPKDEAYIAGLFYGDGYYPGCHSGQRKSTDRSISFSTGSDRKELVPLLNQYFKTEFNDPKELTHAVRASSDVVLDFYEKYPKVDSHNMYIPARIMQADWESKMHFIGGQIDSDGSIGSSRFRYTSVCKEYILQLQLLFQSVGWNGLVREATIKLNGKEFKAYHLIVQSIKAIRRLKKYVRLARKKADCQECLDNKIGARPCNKSPHDPTHRIPWEVYNELPYTKEFYKARNNSRRKKRLICTTLKPYLDELTELDSRWQDVYWFKYEQVERIEVVGEKDVYDLSVEKLHEFNPNGIRVHNCELRVMAHLSGDETYLNAFASGQDPHLAIACKKYHVDYDEILKIHEDESHPDHKLWSVRRKQAKQLAFGLIYGIGASLLAVKLSDPKAGLIVSKEEAQKQMDEFFEEHPKLKTFKAKQERYLKKNGYLKSLFGRKRRLPEIYSGNKEQEAYALRLGLNFPCLLPTSQALCKTKGWVNSDNLQAGDEILAFNSKTGKSEWQPVLEVHTPDYDGDLYKFNSKHCGILSTSYHRWYVSKSEFYEDDIKHRQVQDKEIEEFFTLQKIIHSKYEGGKNLHQISQELNIPYVKVRRIYYGKMKSPLSTKPLEPFEVMTSDEIYNSKGNCRIPVRAYHNNTNENSYTDTFIALCGWYLTDAHIRNNGSIRITQSDSANHEKVLHIRKLLVESGLEYKENIRISDISTAITWSISKDSSSKFIGVLPDRKLNMAFITSLTQAQLEILLYNMRLGDGYSTLCSGDKEQASLIQAMVVLIGKTSSMFRLSYKGKRSYFKNHQPSKLGQEYIEATKDSWGIKFSDRGSIHTKSYGRKLVEKVPYKGKVWCPSVPSGAFFVRYIGDDGRYRTMITGNCQSAASDMCLFGSILIFYLMRQGKLPKMDSVCLVHDANYMNTKPEYINVWTVYTMWNIYRNPSTKHYFGFQIKDVDMDMDFELGRSMAEELPFVPMYDYRKMLQPDFDLEAYMEEAKKYKHISIKDYPKYFAKEMKQYEEDFIKGLY